MRFLQEIIILIYKKKYFQWPLSSVKRLKMGFKEEIYFISTHDTLGRNFCNDYICSDKINNVTERYQDLEDLKSNTG